MMFKIATEDFINTGKINFIDTQHVTILFNDITVTQIAILFDFDQFVILKFKTSNTSVNDIRMLIIQKAKY